jgi:hypothetical protein
MHLYATDSCEIFWIPIAAMLWFPTRLQPSCKAFEKGLLLQMGPAAKWLRWPVFYLTFQNHERRCNIQTWTLQTKIPTMIATSRCSLLRHLQPQHGFSQRLKMLHLSELSELSEFSIFSSLSSWSWTSSRRIGEWGKQDAQVTFWEAVKT